MSGTDIFDQIRVTVCDAQMGIPVDVITARGHARRTRRRLAAAGVAATVALGAGVLGVEHTRRPLSPTGEVTTQLAAFTISSDQGGATSVTLRKGSQYRLDPGALGQALAAHGIPAVVKVGETCDTTHEPPGLDEVVTAERDADGAVKLTINPTAIPAGAELSIGYYATHTTFSLLDGNLPLVCTTRP